jgi:hypothetical protein
MSAPDKIWATGNEKTGSWNHEKGRMRVHLPDDWQTEYTRSDLIPDLIAEAVAREREACAQVIHEEQAEIWTREIMEALAMNGHIDPQTYDDKVEIARLIRDELEVIPAAIRARGQE